MMSSASAVEAALRAAIDSPPPRSDAQVKNITAPGMRGYYVLLALIWGVVVAVALLVGLTSKPAEVVSNILVGLAMGGTIFGIPTALFVWINRRKMRACARRGEAREAGVSSITMRGRPGRQIAEAALQLSVPGNPTPIQIFVSGVPQSITPGTRLRVLYAPDAPGMAAVLIPGLGILVGNVVGGRAGS